MLLRYSCDLDEEADAVESAVKKVLEKGCRTVDIMSEGMQQMEPMTWAVLIAAEI